MRVKLTVSWEDFTIGIGVTWRERIAIALGPILLGFYWGPFLWRCEECQKLNPNVQEVKP